MAAAAVLTGARSITAIAEWAADTPQPVRAALGARRDAPDRWVGPAEATIRRTLARVDPTALAAVIGAWLADRDRPGQQHRRRAVAVDGKTLRGARRDSRQVHLLAAMDHATRAVLGQRQVNGAPGEVPGFAPLLANLDLTGAVVTAEALQTHRDAAEFLVSSKQADYLFTVKANQPVLRGRCARLAWHRVPVLDRTRDRVHGRVELRTLKAVSVGGFGFPHSAQVVQVTHKTRNLGTRQWRTVVVYAVTSLAYAQASPAWLADLLGWDATESTYERRSPGAASKRHGPGRKARGHAERRRSGLSPAGRPPPALTVEGRSVVPALDPDRANAVPGRYAEVPGFGVGPPDHG